MQTIVADLKNRNINVDNSCLIGCIECALPEEFNEWLINWSMRESEPTLNELMDSLNNHVETLKSTEVKAMIASTSKYKPKTNMGDKSCKCCKKEGHDVTECLRLKRKKEAEAKEAQNKQNPVDGAKVATEVDTRADVDIAFAATTLNTEECIWLIDSGASLHMTKNLSWLTNYQELSILKPIRIGDGRIIKAI